MVFTYFLVALTFLVELLLRPVNPLWIFCGFEVELSTLGYYTILCCNFAFYVGASLLFTFLNKFHRIVPIQTHLLGFLCHLLILSSLDSFLDSTSILLLLLLS